MNEKLMRLYARRDVIWNLYGAAHSAYQETKKSEYHKSMRQLWRWMDQIDREIQSVKSLLKH